MPNPNKWQAINEFWSSFGLAAYDENSVPAGARLPYITYSASTGAINNMIILSASIWYYSDSWKDISDKADEIAAEIGYGHITIPVEGGYLMITRGTPFAQRMSDEDHAIRRIYINTQAEFLTAH